MRILVAGGAGFLGPHLSDLLIAEGHSIVCVDNLATGNRVNIERLLRRPDFEFICQDICEPLEINGDIDCVANLASPASPNDYHRLPIETLKAGSLGTLNLLDLALAKNARFLLASTSEIYGDPLQNPQREDYRGNVSPTGPRSVYDEAKRFSEALTMAYHRRFGLPTRIARIFNTYGPGMRPGDGRAVPSFVTQALNNQPITVFGDGSQIRSFCYVSDLVRGLKLLLFSDIVDPVNIGNPQEISILDLAQRIKALTGSHSPIVFRPFPQDDPRLRQPDITRARELLGWKPQVSLDEGLRAMVECLKKESGKNK
jgi:dTDP-glucose 4,6-dehydratase